MITKIKNLCKIDLFFALSQLQLKKKKKQTSALVSKTLRLDYIIYICPVVCQSLEFLRLQIKL